MKKNMKQKDAKKEITNDIYCMSTAVSDAVLAVTCALGVFWLVKTDRTWSGSGLALNYFTQCLVASSLGVFRFGLKNLPTFLKTAHSRASWVAGGIGIPCITAHYYTHVFQSEGLGRLLIFSCLIPLSALLSSSSQLQEYFGKLTVTASVISLIFGGWTFGSSPALVSGILMVILAPLDRPDRLFGIPCVDIFHYILSTTNLILIYGM